jgi:hypothetical protein
MVLCTSLKPPQLRLSSNSRKKSAKFCTKSLQQNLPEHNRKWKNARGWGIVGTVVKHKIPDSINNTVVESISKELIITDFAIQQRRWRNLMRERERESGLYSQETSWYSWSTTLKQGVHPNWPEEKKTKKTRSTFMFQWPPKENRASLQALNLD